MMNSSENSSHGQDSDDARERKKLQNRIAQRKFRERKAQQQRLANAAASGTSSPRGKALEDHNLKGVPPEVIPWLARICPNTGLPIPAGIHIPADQHSEQEGHSFEKVNNIGYTPRSDPQCNKCGKQMFHDSGEMCLCTMTSPQTTPPSLASPHTHEPSVRRHESISSQHNPWTIEDVRTVDTTRISPSVFQTPEAVNMNHSMIRPAHFLLDNVEEMTLYSASQMSEASTLGFPTQLPTPPHTVSSIDYTIHGTPATTTNSNTSGNNINMTMLTSQALNTAHETGQPLLHVATQNGHCNIIRMLIDHHIDINERDASGTTALHIAVRSRNDAAIRLLLQHGADVNARDQEGHSPLFIAVQTGFENAVGLFLSQGSMVQRSNSQRSMVVV